MTMNAETYLALGLAAPAPAEVNGRTLADFAAALAHPGDAAYHPCAEASPDAAVRPGATTTHAGWSDSRIYPGTARDIHVHLPASFDRSTAAGLIIFNDGAMYLDPAGPARAARVLDNLHAGGRIGPTVAVFVDPGLAPGTAERFGSTAEVGATQRSLEYDSLGPDYGRFLVEELLPFVEEAEGVSLTADPARRTIAGISSGGIGAFMAAWHYPQSFGRVLSHCGSFVNIRGGHNVPYLVRATSRKPIRVFLQDGANDASAVFGDWPLANRDLANALAFAGYDFRFDLGAGGHSLRHGGALLAESLRWLWRP